MAKHSTTSAWGASAHRPLLREHHFRLDDDPGPSSLDVLHHDIASKSSRLMEHPVLADAARVQPGHEVTHGLSHGVTISQPIEQPFKHETFALSLPVAQTLLHPTSVIGQGNTSTHGATLRGGQPDHEAAPVPAGHNDAPAQQAAASTSPADLTHHDQLPGNSPNGVSTEIPGTTVETAALSVDPLQPATLCNPLVLVIPAPQQPDVDPLGPPLPCEIPALVLPPPPAAITLLPLPRIWEHPEPIVLGQNMEFQPGLPCSVYWPVPIPDVIICELGPPPPPEVPVFTLPMIA